MGEGGKSINMSHIKGCYWGTEGTSRIRDSLVTMDQWRWISGNEEIGNGSASYILAVNFIRGT